MPQFYVVKGLGAGLDGLIVEGIQTAAMGLTMVLRIIDPNVNVGDRTASLPLPEEAFYVSDSFLERTDDPKIREFDSNNPYGKFMLEGHMECGRLHISYSQYERGLQVSVLEKYATEETPLGPKVETKTIYSENFYRDIVLVKQAIESVLAENGGADADDLVFKLRELKEGEKNG